MGGFFIPGLYGDYVSSGARGGRFAGSEYGVQGASGYSREGWIGLESERVAGVSQDVPSQGSALRSEMRRRGPRPPISGERNLAAGSEGQRFQQDQDSWKDQGRHQDLAVAIHRRAPMTIGGGECRLQRGFMARDFARMLQDNATREDRPGREADRFFHPAVRDSGQEELPGICIPPHSRWNGLRREAICRRRWNFSASNYPADESARFAHLHLHHSAPAPLRSGQGDIGGQESSGLDVEGTVYACQPSAGRASTPRCGGLWCGAAFRRMGFERSGSVFRSRRGCLGEAKSPTTRERM